MVAPLDVAGWGVDFLSADGHKWLLGPEGAGIGYVRREWVERLHPIGVGAFSVARPLEFSTIDFTLKPHAGRWEGGALNVPGITNTPRFQMVLDSIAAANGGGTAGATARGQSEALFKGWVEAFNGQLATRFAGDSRVAIADVYTNFNDQVANPAQYGLTDVRHTACPATGVGSDGLPTYTFSTCTNAALAAAPPAGTTNPDWFRTWLFSDGFHPSGYEHQLIAQLLARSLTQAGWL